MKRLITLILCVLLVSSSLVFPVSSEGTENPGELKIVKTTIRIPGLKNTYRFLQLSDAHFTVVPEDTEQFNYAHSAQRAAHFKSLSPDFDYLNYFQMFYDYADSVDANAVIMTGDMVDFPSDENIDYMYSVVDANSDMTTLYTLGNHDWTYPDTTFGYGIYASTAQYNAFQPKFEKLCVVEECGNKGNCHGSYMDFGEVVVVMLDNSIDQFDYTQSYTLLNKALSLGKPTIVCYHVPLYAETLSESVISMWNYNCVVGSHRGGSYWNLKTQKIVNLLETNENVVGLFCGHIHYGHEDLPYDSSYDVETIPSNGAMQYSCPAAYEGGCRLITITGCDECDHDFSETEVIKAATCRTRGIMKKICSLCGEEVNYVAPSVDHNYEYSVSMEPGCTYEGIGRYMCSMCKDYYYEDIPAAGHSYVLSEYLKEPTYAEGGEALLVCEGCGDVKRESVPAREVIIGDCDIDYEITVRDITALRNILVNRTAAEGFVKICSDINGDGKINSKDLRLLKIMFVS